MLENFTLKPCPFCGSTELDVSMVRDCTIVAIRCETCGAENGIEHCKKGDISPAVKNWNTRYEAEEK